MRLRCTLYTITCGYMVCSSLYHYMWLHGMFQRGEWSGAVHPEYHLTLIPPLNTRTHTHTHMHAYAHAHSHAHTHTHTYTQQMPISSMEAFAPIPIPGGMVRFAGLLRSA